VTVAGAASRREITEVDKRPFGEHYCTPHRGHQLAHIAGPAMGQHRGHRIRSEAFQLAPRFRARIRRRNLDIALALAQGGRSASEILAHENSLCGYG
jgi:hypothetical protein